MPFMRKAHGTKNDLDDFEAQGFVRRIDDGVVRFDYRGLDMALVNGSVTSAHFKWAFDLLSRLSQKQWQDAFRAGGYSAGESELYIKKIADKIADATRLMANSPEVSVADCSLR